MKNIHWKWLLVTLASLVAFLFIIELFPIVGDIFQWTMVVFTGIAFAMKIYSDITGKWKPIPKQSTVKQCPGNCPTTPINSISEGQMRAIRNAQCGSCVHKLQGPTCCYCGNPNQTDESLKGYVYYNFWCPLHKYKKVIEL